jgi:hypothetical protein
MESVTSYASIFDLPGLGAAYLVLLATVTVLIACITASRFLFVVTPNRTAKYYALYVVMVLASLLIAATLENRLVPAQATTLAYAMFPQVIMLVVIHLWIYYDQQPWSIALGASALIASAIGTVPGTLVAGDLTVAHWLTLCLFAVLLAYLFRYSISTKRGFVTASSIYLDSKETSRSHNVPQTPWLGLPQWVSLISASILLAMLNATLQGSGLADIPALAVFAESVLILSVTAAVCTIPAAIYWLAHKHWMPELTRFVWLVWIVVGFAFTYGNFLASLDRA